MYFRTQVWCKGKQPLRYGERLPKLVSPVTLELNVVNPLVDKILRA